MIRKCFFCNIYTMKDLCPKCGRVTRKASPPKYRRKYGYYRRLCLYGGAAVL